jgi:hypothetical protein
MRREYTVTAIEPGMPPVIASWDSEREAREFFALRAGWLAQKGYRKDVRRSTRHALRCTSGLQTATVTLIARDAHKEA